MRKLAMSLVLAAAATAQYPISANALRWNGAFPAGTSCWGFSCTPQPTSLLRGETGSLFIRANQFQGYVIGLSFTATRCLTITGAYNQLVLDDPITIFLSGTLSQVSPILSCPSGFDTIPITVPLTLPVGLTFSLQGVTGVPTPAGGGVVSFTQAITFTVI